MPAEIPGYWYDASSNRYFKIQANHIAPSGANYSRQAVNAEKVIQKSQRREKQSRLSKQAATVSRSSLLQNPLLNFDRRLGNLHYDAGTTVAEYYAAGLSGAEAIVTKFGKGKSETAPLLSSGAINKFAIDPGSGALLAALSCPYPFVTPARSISLVFAIPRRGWPLLVDDFSEGQEDWTYCADEDAGGCLYDATQKRLVHYTRYSQQICCIAAEPRNSVSWVSVDSTGERSEFGGACYDERHIPSVCYATRGTQMIDLAVSSSSGTIAMATSDGVSILSNFGRSHHEIQKTPVRGEQMVVEFKDEWVVMSGARNGRLMLCDVRSPDDMSAVFRIQHSSAINGLATMPDRNQVLVNGLQDMKIYDLRYAPRPARTELLDQVKSRSRSRRRGPAHYAPTPAVLTFNTPSERHQNQYGLGFAYDPELNVVVSASTDHVRNHRVGIWSASSGRLLKSPLNEHRFTAPVTCAQIARVRDGPKSILLASDGKISEWCVQGRGFERDQEVGPED